MKELYKLEDYPFESSDFYFYLKNLYKDRGFKAFYQFFNRPHRRQYSRGLIQKYSPYGHGLEIGCGARTICPTNRTILSDAFSVHGTHNSIARVFFNGEDILYKDETFSFLVSEHVLEHITNPIKALNEWLRVLKKEGLLYLVLPHKERTNDSLRAVTTLQHVIEDFKNNIPYNDSFHFEDWYSSIEANGGVPQQYLHLDPQELLDTASIHHHVWTDVEIVELLEYLGMKIIFKDERMHDRRDSFIVIAQKK